MITNWHMDRLSTQDQFIDYSRAYLKAAIDVCRRMVCDEHERIWSNGTVVNMLASHSVELFLKGLIIHRNDKYSIKTHDIDALIGEFERLYPEEPYKVDIPYKTVNLGGAESSTGNPKHTPPSLLYRYPVNEKKGPWIELCGIEPEDFLEFLEKWQDEANRMVRNVADTI